MIIEVMRVGSREVYRKKSGLGEKLYLCFYCFMCFMCGFMFALILAMAFV